MKINSHFFFRFKKLVINRTRLTKDNVKRVNKSIFSSLKDTILQMLKSEGNNVSQKLIQAQQQIQKSSTNVAAS